MAKVIAELECSELVKIFTTENSNVSRAVLKGIDLKCKTGELICIIGPSGSGKTTLLQIISGFLKPDAGFVKHDTQIINNFSRKKLEEYWRETITFIYQDPYDNVFPHLPIKRNILIACNLSKNRRFLNDEFISRVLLEVDLKKHLSTPSNRLSGGEIQKLAFAIAIIRNSQLILLDEPTGEIDAEASQNIFQILTSLCHRKKMIGILVTHDKLALKYATRAFSLTEGRLNEIKLNK
ncbi:MAG: ABC transporter ATP-binding protein [Candidatus Thorarchaeota archaeon]